MSQGGWRKPGSTSSSFQSTITALLWGQAAYAHSSRADSRLPIVFLLGPQPSKQPTGSYSPLLDPGTGYVTGVTHSPGHISIYVISLSLESLPGTQVSTVPFLPTQFCIDHSYSLSCIVVFMLSFWIVFSENYSLCRCIFFYLFMGSGEVHVLLFHYLDLYPYI